MTLKKKEEELIVYVENNVYCALLPNILRNQAG